jgi:hypothetical protein
MVAGLRAKKETTLPILIKHSSDILAPELLQLALNNMHPISKSYTAIDNGSSVVISAKFSRESAYYNLALDINGREMKYEDTFLKFGYGPQYNLLSYLENINPIFNASKEFLAMARGL